MRTLIWIACLSIASSVCSVARAYEGFALSLELGGCFWNLDQGSLDASVAELRLSDGQLLTETLSSGFATRLSLSYTILGYSTVELGMTLHGWNLGGEDVGGSGHGSLVAHIHPLQFFLPERRYDVSAYLGGGYGILGGGQPIENNNRGLIGPTLEWGFTARYFLTPWFSAGTDLRFLVPFYKTWYVNWDNGEKYTLETSPDGYAFNLLFTATFHFLSKSSERTEPQDEPRRTDRQERDERDERDEEF